MERMITRTIKTRKVTVLCLNTETGEPFNETVILPKKYRAKDDLKRAAEMLDSETVKVCKVVDVTETETRYGMTEAAFIEVAEVLPGKEQMDAKAV